MKDYYKVLIINRNAESSDIKKAYRTLALKWHPDINKDFGAQEKFIEINEAYEILNNNSKRKIYDVLYNDYVNSLNAKSQSKVDNEKFTRYNSWSNEARQTAYNRSKMPYSEFAKTVGKVYEGASNGCGIIFAIAMWIAWGPAAMISLIQGAVDMVRDFPDYGFKTRYIFLVLFLLLSIIVTLVGVFAFFSYLKKISNE
jgi:hypothetical protein